MPLPFKLSVPADPRFRAVLMDVTAKCAELAGGSAADGQALAKTLAGTVTGMAPGPNAQIDLSYTPGHAGVDVTASCAGRSATIHHAIAVSKP